MMADDRFLVVMVMHLIMLGIVSVFYFAVMV